MKILIIEDDEKIIKLIQTGLEKNGFVVDTASNGEMGVEKIQLTTTYDLIILDLMLPEIDGFSILRLIRKLEKRIPVIILSAKHTFEDRVEGLTNGADDYVVKPFFFPELLIRIQNLLKRIPRIEESGMLEYYDLQADLIKREIKRDNKKIDLQIKEYDLLLLLLKHQEIVLSKTMILKDVWGYDFNPQTNVVDVLICRLRNKIDKGAQVKLIHTIRGLGYVLRKD